MSGEYQFCGYGDCFDIAVGMVGTRSLCGLCDEAGCVIGDSECQREDAYDHGRGDEHGTR
ncbi:hypothetical protein [Nocardia sp. NPDC050406]|uniref:hypothetical protein n=1 Tax=Nocardia sp. NPDC050406 TaxID=3364318 RepID=UPI0037ADEDD5